MRLSLKEDIFILVPCKPEQKQKAKQARYLQTLGAKPGGRSECCSEKSVSVSGIENLPCELQRNFQLMRELDQRTEGGFRPSVQPERGGARILGWHWVTGGGAWCSGAAAQP